MVVNFRVRGLSRGARKLAQTPILNKKKKKKLAWTSIMIESPGSLKRPSKKYEIINWNMHSTDAWQDLGFIPGTLVDD